MRRQITLLLIGAGLLLAEVLYFRDTFIPVQWDLTVKGLACTCPDERVIEGVEHLKSITPDSLKIYHLDYSEIYVTERPVEGSDYMGTDLYEIKGAVIGKKRVSEGERWNPIFRVDKWGKADSFIGWLIKSFLAAQLLLVIVLYIVWKR